MAVTNACTGIRKSEKFKLFLELVLFIGNYMNAGSRNAQSFGFDIDFLLKLRDTKTSDNSQTLLHFIADLVENDPEYRKIKGFQDDLQ